MDEKKRKLEQLIQDEEAEEKEETFVRKFYVDLMCDRLQCMSY